MMSALPTALKMSIAPPALSCTTTTLLDAFPAVALTFDVPGGVPAAAGYAVRNVLLDTLVTVRWSTMAVAPDGIPLAPLTCHVSVSFPGARWNAVWPAVRLSRARTGVIGVNALCTGVVACAARVCHNPNASGRHIPAPTNQRRCPPTWSRF